MKLVVTNAFGSYAVGAEITDAVAMAKALDEHPESVVPVDDAPTANSEAAK